jgi:hypothetical protein
MEELPILVVIIHYRAKVCERATQALRAINRAATNGRRLADPGC